MAVTIKDIARIAEVSYSTVSRALSGHREISEETRRKINEICKQLNYSPNGVARGLVKKNSRTIGLIVPDITNPFFSEIALGVEAEARKRGYNVFLCNTDWSLDREEEYFNVLMEKRVEGVIIAPVSNETEALVEKYAGKLPIVFAGSKPLREGFNFVAADDFKGSCIATEYLLNLGHTKIAFIGGKENTNSFHYRLNGYRRTMEDRGFDSSRQLVRSGSFKKEGGKLLTKLLLEEGDIPTAVVAANDIVALGVMEAVEEFGLKIPDDVSIIGFDDIPYAAFSRISLTTVRQSKKEQGKSAVSLLFELFGGDAKGGLSETFQMDLVTRGTCRGR